MADQEEREQPEALRRPGHIALAVVSPFVFGGLGFVLVELQVALLNRFGPVEVAPDAIGVRVAIAAAVALVLQWVIVRRNPPLGWTWLVGAVAIGTAVDSSLPVEAIGLGPVVAAGIVTLLVYRGETPTPDPLRITPGGARGFAALAAVAVVAYALSYANGARRGPLEAVVAQSFLLWGILLTPDPTCRPGARGTFDTVTVRYGNARLRTKRNAVNSTFTARCS